MKDDEIIFGLYSTRMLVFIETEPQSNEYYQVLLNGEEFKKVSLSLGKIVGKEPNGDDTVEVVFSKEKYKLPDLREINE